MTKISTQSRGVKPSPLTDGETYRLIFENTQQAFIVSLTGSGRITLANKAACTLLGYTQSELLRLRLGKIFRQPVKEKGSPVKKDHPIICSVAPASGILLNCLLSTSGFADSKGKSYTISCITDLSGLATAQRSTYQVKERAAHKNIKQQQAKALALLTKNNDWLKRAGKVSYDIMWDWDVSNNKIYVGDSAEELFGYRMSNNTISFADFRHCLLPKERKGIEHRITLALASRKKSWKDSFHFKHYDGSVAFITSRASIVRDDKGKALHFIGAMKDVSRLQELEEDALQKVSADALHELSLHEAHEEKMEDAMKLKERQIAAATEDAKADERSHIGSELHDNINQLLGASRMYLEMAKRGDRNTRMYLTRSSEYTLTAIEEIRKLTKGLSTDIIKNLGLCIAIENLAHDMMEVNEVTIACTLSFFKENAAGHKLKLNIFRIIQEHLNNILKHAKAKRVGISLAEHKGSVQLIISDDGIGFDTRLRQKGVGIAHIKNRAATYKGVADFISEPGKGCVLKVSFGV